MPFAFGSCFNCSVTTRVESSSKENSEARSIFQRFTKLSDNFFSLCPSAATALPSYPGETKAQRRVRFSAESDARKVSNGIDEMLRLEKKMPQPSCSVLLLGPSESGKTTVLKQLQLLYAPETIQRMEWRTVVYLNLVQSIKVILEALTLHGSNAPNHHAGYAPETASLLIAVNDEPSFSRTAFDYYIEKLKPVVELEERLTQSISSLTPESEPAMSVPLASKKDVQSTTVNCSSNKLQIFRSLKKWVLFSRKLRPCRKDKVRSGGASTRTYEREASMEKYTESRASYSTFTDPLCIQEKATGENGSRRDDPDDPAHTLNACASVMIQLYHDPQVKERLQARRMHMEDMSGFFLDEIPRITSEDYVPTNPDILKARRKTKGIAEHTIFIPGRKNRPVAWRFYDVGATRNNLRAWARHLTSLSAIVFVAPISTFDQLLPEGPHVNRLEDTILLWKVLVENILLAHVNIVLLMNKCDLLKSKLEAGARLGDHMISYGDRPNDYESITRYFRHKFAAIHHSYTPNKKREVYIHFTSIISDKSRIGETITATVRDIIIKTNLRNMRVLK